jgi:hypothetical protein
MPDEQTPATAETTRPRLDTGMLPIGEVAWRSILDHVVAVGDEAESTYLEVKSSLDLTKPEGRAKVSKFLLGMANRMPEQAALYLHGYAVLVIGAARGDAVGVPRGTEFHDLDNAVRPYLGSEFPGFELGRLTVDDEREVLFVIARPPADGQPIFPCFKDLQGSNGKAVLSDGGIYVRGQSSSRPARAGEVLRLVERARGGGKPPIDLSVEVLGELSRVTAVDEVLEGLFEITEQQFNQSQEPVAKINPLFGNTFNLTQSRPPSEGQRAAWLEQWKKDRPANLQNGRERLLGAALPGTGIRVLSHGRSIERPQLIVTFHDCEAFMYEEADDVGWDELVEPIEQPTGSAAVTAYRPRMMNIRPANRSVDWATRGQDVVVTIAPESFRPDTPWSTDLDDHVVVARDPEASAVVVTWALTEAGSDKRSTGGCEVSTDEPLDGVDLVKRLIGKDES